MNALLQHMLLSLRLNFRSPQAVVYGYLFPIAFLFAFWGIYSKEVPPLRGELAQLLTVTILSGACFGLPTTLVSERERGVWRRYRLLPRGTDGIILSAMVGRVFIIASAVIIQLLLARYVCGAEFPAHPFRLAVYSLFVCFAFLGIGLMIAMLAGDVPAVQALGQMIFLPMLMIGGIGVKLSVLPNWARHVAGFLPGLYSVDALEHAIFADPRPSAVPTGFCLTALFVIGVVGCAAGRMMFRWDAGQSLPAKARAAVLLAMGSCVGIGLIAQQRGYIRFRDESPASSIAQATTQPAWMSITMEQSQAIRYNDLEPDWSTVTPLAPSLDNLNNNNAPRMHALIDKLKTWPPGHVADVEQRVRNLLSALGVADVLQDDDEHEIAFIFFEEIRSQIDDETLRKLMTHIANTPNAGAVLTQSPELGWEGEITETDSRQRVRDYARKMLAKLLNKSAEYMP
jgi:ABC-2 type transport system permease protein